MGNAALVPPCALLSVPILLALKIPYKPVIDPLLVKVVIVPEL